MRREKRDRLLASGRRGVPGRRAAHPHDRAGPRGVPGPRGRGRRRTTRSASPAAWCSSGSAASSASPRCRTARATGCRPCSAWRRSARSALAAFKTDVDLGDHLFVHGRVIASRRGELSVFADAWQMAAKSLRPLPNLYEGVELSEEARVRQRYVDLIVRPKARETARQRPALLRSLRDNFHAPRLHRDRDADAADAAGRCRGAAVRHAHERVRHGPVPADRARAVPQARAGRRHRAGLRDQPQLPQRGCRLHALAGVRDARGVRVLRRLRHDGGADPGPGADGGAGRARHLRRGDARRRGVRPRAASGRS